MKNSEFFNRLSLHYDEMIQFENSLQNKLKGLRNFIEPTYKTALDLGCATGADAIALAQLGLAVDAIDHSEEMIRLAIKNANDKHIKINFSVSDLNEFEFEKSFDIIVSLGNTFANISFDDAREIIGRAAQKLNPSGKIIIQIINYSNIPKEDEFILNTFENERVKIIRKYLFENTNIHFTIELLDKLNDKLQKISTKMFAHSVEKFYDLAEQNLLHLNVYENLSKHPFMGNSRDLVVCLSKYVKNGSEKE